MNLVLARMVLKITIIANRTKGDTKTGERDRVGLSYNVPSPSLRHKRLVRNEKGIKQLKLNCLE